MLLAITLSRMLRSYQIDAVEHNEVAELVRKLMSCDLEQQELPDSIAIEIARAAPIFKARYKKLCSMGALNESREELFNRYESRTHDYEARNSAPPGMPNAWAIKSDKFGESDTNPVCQHFEICHDLTICGSPMAAETVSILMYKVPAGNRWKNTSSSSNTAGTSRAWQESMTAWIKQYDMDIMTLPPFSIGASEWCSKVLALWHNANEAPLNVNLSSLMKQFGEATD